jgi:methionyl aminopeptidase
MMKLKTIDEIARIREACVVAAETHKGLAEMIEPGITTGELDRWAKHFINKRGGTPAFLNYMGFPASLCVSVNEEVIHGIPGKRSLTAGDIVSIDLGVELAGYYSDMAATYPVGKIDPELEQLVRVTKESLDLGLEQAIFKQRIHDISRAVYDHASSYGYGVVREYCGHGVGYSQHEDPQIPNYVSRGPNPRLKKGMVLAIEPMINLGSAEVDVLSDGWTVVTEDRQPSAHWEHTIAIFEDHTEILTAGE